MDNKMEKYAEFEHFDLEKFSIFAKWFKKYYLADKDRFSEEYFHGLVSHLEEKDRIDVFVFKLNAFWDAGSSIQDMLLKDAKHLIAVFTNFIQNFLSKEQSTLDPQASTSAVKMITYLYNRSSNAINDTIEDENVLQKLEELIDSPKCLVETALLAGSAIVTIVLLNSTSDEDSIKVLVEILTREAASEYFKMCLMNGILCCGGSLILMVQEKDSGMLFIYFIFDGINRLCRKSSGYDFQSFLLLKMWCSKLKEICSQVTSDTDNKYTVELPEDYVVEILNICKNNFENAVKGVSELCFEAFRDILAVTYFGWTDTEHQNKFLTNILDQTMSLKWSQKSKYIQLSALLPQLGVEAVLALYPSIPADLSVSLTSPHLVHAGAEVYKIIIKVQSLEQWTTHFGSILIGNLLSSTSGLRNSCLDQWLPVTLKQISSSQTFILEQLGTLHSEEAMVATVTTLKICKKMGIVQDLVGSVDPLEKIKECLLHSSPELRCSAFAVLCHAKKKGTVPSPAELPLILDFLATNGSVGCTKFRQSVESSFATLLMRCRDYSAMMFRNKQKQKDEGELELVIEFLNDCLETLLSNLLPGGNYQRKIYSLDMLLVFINNFFCFTNQGANKCSGNGDPQDFMKYANEKSKICLYTERNFNVLILNIDDHMVDVKAKSEGILEYFNPDDEVLKDLAIKMHDLVNSPKEGNCESGALLAKLICNWGKNREQPKDFHIDLKSVCNYLLDLYKTTLNKCGEDFLLCARKSPLYGLITSLRKCLLDNNSAERLSFNQDKIGELIQVMEETVSLMLHILCGDMTENETANPDFQEIAVAINKIIAASGDDEELDDAVPISEDHQLVLSAAWHSLKECALLSGYLVNLLPLECHPEASSCSMSLMNTEKCSKVLMSILSSCRHKGAIEATNLASGLFATSILNSNIKPFHQITSSMLEQVFLQLKTSWSNSSYTRRSAGLPGLIQKLVSSEPPNKTRSLLPKAVNDLIELARSEDFNEEAEDSAASHSLHILRSIVQDTHVSREIGQYITRIAGVCLETFQSSSWSVRNAGLQLFGSLSPRIVGQKKVRDDAEGYNNVDVEEVDARFPGLVQLLVDKLLRSQSNDKCLLDSSIVPILTILARMESSMAQSTLSTQVTDSVERFSSCPVVQVRSLAAQILAQFKQVTADEMVATVITKLKNEEDSVNNSVIYCTNRKHFDVLIVLELVRRDKIESPAALSTSMYEVDQLTNCYVIKTEILLIQDLLKIKTSESYRISTVSTYVCEPGYHNWKHLQRQRESSVDIDKPIVNSFEEAKDVTEAIILSSDNFDNGLKFLQQLLDSSHCNGLLVSNLIDFFLSADVLGKINPESNNQLFNSEAAIDLLDALDHELLQSEQLGVATSAKAMKLRAVCLNVMLIQEDWEWFFGDTSEYVSRMVENSEQILKYSDPTNIETSRQIAAEAILAYLPTLQQRQIKDKMALVLQFGFVNLLNASLVLLQDEDPDLRAIVVRFGSGLPRPEWTVQYPALSKHLSINMVVWFGLEQLAQVVELFTPVVETITAPSHIPVDYFVTEESQPSFLFKRGDGVNVYSEGGYTLQNYYTCIKQFLQHGSLKMDLVMGMDNVVKVGQKVGELLKTEKNVFSGTRTVKGFHMVTSVQAMLNLIAKDGVMKNKPDVDLSKECLRISSLLNENALWPGFVL